MENKKIFTSGAGSDLIGALIGLVRATDGVVHMTENTFNIILEGLYMHGSYVRPNSDEIQSMIDRVHIDKHTLVPDCSVCGSPCGRTEDYDWKSVRKRAESGSELDVYKLKVLDILQRLADSIKTDELRVDAAMRFLICRAVFSLGEQWSDIEMETLIKELKTINISKGDGGT